MPPPRTTNYEAALPRRSLSVRTATGFAWLMAWRVMSRGLGIISTLVLVRVLAPADFGLVALAMSITSAVELLSALGVEDAVVRFQNPTKAVYDTAFTLNLIRGLSNAAIIGAIAWPIAMFFNEPRLTALVFAIALAIAVGGLENIGIVEFRRNLAYDQDLKLRVFPRLAGFATTLILALLYHSYWALVLGSLASRVATVAMSYTFHPHRPRLTLAAHRELLGFSAWVWVISLVGMLRDRIEVFLLGRLLGPGAVGTFTVAIEIALLPMSELIQPLASVLFSSFSRSSQDDGTSRALFLRFLGLCALVSLPAGIGLALVADPLARVALGERWLQAIPLMRVLSVGIALTTFGFFCRAVLEARGRMFEIFQVNVITAIVRLVLGVVLVSRMGVMGAAVVMLAGSTIDQGFLFHQTCRVLSLRWTEILGRLLRPVLCCSAMAAVVLATGLQEAQAGRGVPALSVQLLLCVSLGATVYVASVLLLWWSIGRPDGPEADTIEAASRSIRSTRSSLRRRFAGPVS